MDLIRVLILFLTFSITSVAFGDSSVKCDASSDPITCTATCSQNIHGKLYTANATAISGIRGVGGAQSEARINCNNSLAQQISQNGEEVTLGILPEKRNAQTVPKKQTSIKNEIAVPSEKSFDVKFEKYEQLPNGSLQLTCTSGSQDEHFSEVVIADSRLSAQQKCTDKMSKHFPDKFKTQQEVQKDLADGLGFKLYTQCKDKIKMKNGSDITPEIDKKCFDIATKIAKNQVDSYMNDNCQRSSPQSLIVTCKDGSTYKLADKRGPIGQHDTLADNISDIERSVFKQPGDVSYSTNETVNSSAVGK